MITTEKLSKEFSGFKALESITCNIPDGSIYGMVGSNGAGKSPFLRIITGVYLPDSGEFEVTDLATNGVYLQDGTRLTKNTPKLVACGTVLWLSTQEEQILLTVENV